MATATVRNRSGSSASTSSKATATSSQDVGGSGRHLTLVITGGSGWLGSTIASLACKHWDGLQAIRLFDCNPPDREVILGITGFSTPVDHPRVSYHHGNVLDEDDLLACFAKADVVIHCAAVVERGSFLGRRSMKHVNVDGTHNVIQACLECGVRALVFAGTLGQVQGLHTAKPVRYDELYQLGAREKLIFPHYGGSKNEAENLVLLADGKEGKEGVALRTCSLRCPTMYGEGDKEVVPWALRMARYCFGYYIPLGLLGNSGITLQTMYVGNGAWAHILAARRLLEGGGDARSLEGGGASVMGSCEECSGVEEDIPSKGKDIGGKFYYIGDHSPVCSMTNFLSQFLRPLGYHVFPFGIPFVVLRIVAFFLEILLILLCLLRVDISSGLNRRALKLCKLSHSVSWDKANRELDYTPLYPHKTALARSMEFYRRVL